MTTDLASIRRASLFVVTLAVAAGSSGCVVATVVGGAVAVGATAVGVATDVAVGTAKVVGSGVGAAARAADGEVEKKDDQK
jgi:hypothetical protein